MKKKYSAQQREELLLKCNNSGLSAVDTVYPSSQIVGDVSPKNSL